jgi:MFS family permease
MKKTLVIGALAWPLRYFIYAMQQPVWLVLISNSFHGVGFAFVFVTSYIYIDRVAPKDIRASAQSLLTLLTLGFGNWLGTWFSGRLKDYYTTFVPDPANAGKTIPGAVNWPMVFLIPAVLTTVCAIAYWFTFKEPRTASDLEIGEAELGTVGA